jgi:hypothetical protein
VTSVRAAVEITGVERLDSEWCVVSMGSARSGVIRTGSDTSGAGRGWVVISSHSARSGEVSSGSDRSGVAST